LVLSLMIMAEGLEKVVVEAFTGSAHPKTARATTTEAGFKNIESKR